MSLVTRTPVYSRQLTCMKRSEGHAERRTSRRERIERLGIMLELFCFGAGAIGSWSDIQSGHPPSRPALIALVAGTIGLCATLFSVFIAPRLRERKHRNA